MKLTVQQIDHVKKNAVSLLDSWQGARGAGGLLQSNDRKF